MGEHINFLQEVIVKGKTPKEVTDALKDRKDLSAFHTSVSITLGTSLQHLTIFLSSGQILLSSEEIPTWII